MPGLRLCRFSWPFQEGALPVRYFFRFFSNPFLYREFFPGFLSSGITGGTTMPCWLSILAFISACSGWQRRFYRNAWGLLRLCGPLPFGGCTMEYLRSHFLFLSLPWGLLAHTQYRYPVSHSDGFHFRHLRSQLCDRFFQCGACGHDPDAFKTLAGGEIRNCPISRKAAIFFLEQRPASAFF